MDNSDKGRFSAALTLVAVLWEKELSVELMGLYFRALEDLPADTVIKSLELTTRRCTYFPKPAEIRELAEGSPDDRAQQAWQTFLDAVEKIGPYDSLAFDARERAIGEAILRTFGSWPGACGQFSSRGVSLDDPKWPEGGELVLSDEMVASRQKTFKQNYRLALRQPVERLPRHLPGTFELENSRIEPEALARLDGKYGTVWVIGERGCVKHKAPWRDGRIDLSGMEPVKQLPRAPDRKLLTPEQGLLHSDQRLLTPDQRLSAPDRKLLTPEQGLLHPNQRLSAPEQRLLCDGAGELDGFEASAAEQVPMPEDVKALFIAQQAASSMPGENSEPRRVMSAGEYRQRKKKLKKQARALQAAAIP